MLRRFSVAFLMAGAALWVAPSLAAAPAKAPVAGPLDGTFNNTVKITSKDGEELVYFNPDGSFIDIGPGPDQDSSGTWKVKGDQICTKTKDTPESCGVFRPGRTVGDKWQHKIGDDTVTIEIIKGR